MRSTNRSFNPRVTCHCGAYKEVWAAFCRSCFLKLSPALRNKLCASRGAINQTVRDRAAYDAAVNECLEFLAALQRAKTANERQPGGAKNGRVYVLHR